MTRNELIARADVFRKPGKRVENTYDEDPETLEARDLSIRLYEQFGSAQAAVEWLSMREEEIPNMLETMKKIEEWESVAIPEPEVEVEEVEEVPEHFETFFPSGPVSTNPGHNYYRRIAPGKKRSIRTCRKIAKARTGRKHSPETIEKMRQKARERYGSVPNQLIRTSLKALLIKLGLAKARRENPTRRRMSTAHRGKTHTQETKRKIGVSIRALYQT